MEGRGGAGVFGTGSLRNTCGVTGVCKEKGCQVLLSVERKVGSINWQ